MRILLVDDSIGVRTRLAAMLREHPGLDVREASDVRQAVEVLEDAGVDVLVLDLHLGAENGLDVLSRARDLGRQPPMTIVLTNDASDTHRRQSLLRGAQHFLDKSRDFERLIALVEAKATAFFERP